VVEVVVVTLIVVEVEVVEVSVAVDVVTDVAVVIVDVKEVVDVSVVEVTVKVVPVTDVVVGVVVVPVVKVVVMGVPYANVNDLPHTVPYSVYNLLQQPPYMPSPPPQIDKCFLASATAWICGQSGDDPPLAPVRYVGVIHATPFGDHSCMLSDTSIWQKVAP
jgi:hypothetical protein